MQGGRLGANAQVRNRGLIEWQGGDVTGEGLVNEARGTLRTAPGQGGRFVRDAVLRNEGSLHVPETITLSSTSIFDELYTLLENTNTGICTLVDSGGIASEPGSTMINEGTIRKVGASAVTISARSFINRQRGRIHVEEGSLTLDDIVQFEGASEITLDGGSELIFPEGPILTTEVRVAGGVLTINGMNGFDNVVRVLKLLEDGAPPFGGLGSLVTTGRGQILVQSGAVWGISKFNCAPTFPGSPTESVG